jgi:NAD(P)-dependent dehydrogenase (short-subunit alcohol dehydrogenase family)
MRILITGTSHGIGRALAQSLVVKGHQVWGVARSDQSELVAGLGDSFVASRCDVADWSQVDRVASEVAAAWPHLDGLITCAAIHGQVGHALFVDPLNWSATVRANLDGTYYAIRALHGLLSKAPRRAKVVCFSGGGATKPRPYFSAYAAAKAGMVRLVETIAEEVRGRPIDINAVSPGIVITRLTEEVLALGPDIAGAADFRAATLQRSAGAEPMAKAVRLAEWLLSAESDGVSGQLLSEPVPR